jgi:hypothetical protein
MSQAYGKTPIRHTAGRVARYSQQIHSRTENVLTLDNKKKEKKKKYILPRRRHKVYTKIIIPWLSEGFLPRELRCTKPNEIFSQHGRNRILRAGNISAPHNGRPGRTSLHTTGRNWKKGKGVSRDRPRHKGTQEERQDMATARQLSKGGSSKILNYET